MYSYAQFTQDVLDDAHLVELKNIKATLFSRINQLVPIDSGRWLTRTSVSESYHMSGMYLYHLPPERDAHILPRYHHHDVLYKAIVANMGTAINIESLMSDDEWFASDMYIHTFKDYGLSRACSIVVPCSYTDVYNGLGFYRQDKDHRFTEQERQYLEDAAHFVSRVLRNSFLNTLRQSASEVIDNCAIFDHLGRVVDSTPLFKSCVKSLMPDKEFTTLPTEWFLPNRSPSVYELGGAKFHITYLQDLYLVVLKTKTIFDAFTEKQKLVAEYMVQGASNGEIAKGLAISPHTAAEHARNVQEKCGISGQGSTARVKTVLFLSGQLGS